MFHRDWVPLTQDITEISEMTRKYLRREEQTVSGYSSKYLSEVFIIV